MSDSWHHFLSSQSLSDNCQGLAENALYPLEQHSFLLLEGPDSAKFLQGQISCDINALSLEQSGLGSHSTAKGRMQSSFRICQISEHSYLLRVHSSIAEQALTALKKYIVFSKADIAISHNYVAIGAHGEKAAAQLSTLINSKLPSQSYHQSISEQAIIICSDAEKHSYELYIKTECAQQLWVALAEQLACHNQQQHTLLENHLGLAFVEAASFDAFIPQHFNYQLTPAISFKKGCYTGQEIIARMQYLGKLKRHMYHFIVSAEQALQVNDGLTLEGSTKNIGHIISAVNTQNNEWDVLLNLTADAAEKSQLIHNDKIVTMKEVLPLPYASEGLATDQEQEVPTK